MFWKPDDFAAHEYRDHVVFRELARIESDPEFRRILTELAEQERQDYEQWLALSERKTFSEGTFGVWFAKLSRKLLGLSFTVRYIHRREETKIRIFEARLKEAPTALRSHVQHSLDRERSNETRLIGEIKEEKVEFISSVILGLNDGLIELTGALVGFSFALQGTTLVALTGSITGIAASLSMASSAYMQARHEEHGKDPVKAAFYTGISYFFVVILLVTPFLLTDQVRIALASMFIAVLLIITAISYYTAVIFDRNFGVQFRQMVLFSLGVSAVAFFIGTLFRKATGITIS